MKSVIIKPKSKVLRKYVQYFLFFRKADDLGLHYTTFANNNLCLAVYKENDVKYSNPLKENNCIVEKGRTNFTSKMFGFHKTPFQVAIHSPLEQFCIVFYPSALRAFSLAPYADLMSANHVFEEVFSVQNTNIVQEIFSERDFFERASKLERLLLEKIRYTVPYKVEEALHLISTLDQHLNVEDLAKELAISTPSLFRLFKNNIGQSPKSYLKTLRFRSALGQILNKTNSLTEIGYDNQYFDQAHFINDFKTFSGHSPIQLINKIAVEQNELTWIYNRSE